MERQKVSQKWFVGRKGGDIPGTTMHWKDKLALTRLKDRKRAARRGISMVELVDQAVTLLGQESTSFHTMENICFGQEY